MRAPAEDRLDFDKGDGLVPAIVQDAVSGHVLMLGYMNREAYRHTLATGRVTFYSRSRQSLWQKGETSGNVLELTGMRADCDGDTLLVTARPAGPTCHKGWVSCFGDDLPGSAGFAGELEAIIAGRLEARPEGSYVTSLAEAGPRRVAQKVGEEGVETALAGAAGEPDELIDEAADLLFHLQVLLALRGKGLADVLACLERRHAG
jgi:phosphoribosyl-ATP pyrophosphohydrolase/phosphoribosyl-AMP cyclohydrolase